ncbi:hypothetical protein P879_11106 [Paragonimus westermani]|uniref:Uncharacterized protein n=1 Tax=Paragonimus westermani TaxID=34504 RepID=A0A8T0D9E8_9TREM|nr:hypothetical protein P879_11106 [Paragonimus westermani]
MKILRALKNLRLATSTAFEDANLFCVYWANATTCLPSENHWPFIVDAIIKAVNRYAAAHCFYGCGSQHYR